MPFLNTIEPVDDAPASIDISSFPVESPTFTLDLKYAGLPTSKLPVTHTSSTTYRSLESVASSETVSVLSNVDGFATLSDPETQASSVT